MTRRERAIMDMSDAFDAELTESIAIYTGNHEFEDGVATFRQNKQAADAAALVAFPAEQKFSKTKLAAKTDLAINLSILCDLAFVKLKKLKQFSIADTLSTNKSDYLYLPDEECVNLCKAMHKILFDNMELINIPSITTQILADLLKEIEAFRDLKGTSKKVREVSPVHTQAFKDTLPPLLDSVDDLQRLVGFYFKPSPDFYARVMATSSIPTVHVIHTYIIITAILKSTWKPAPGITFALAKAKKTGITDRDGVLPFDEVRSGDDVLTGTFEGKEVVYKKVNIKRSTTNHWEVVIEGM